MKIADAQRDLETIPLGPICTEGLLDEVFEHVSVAEVDKSGYINANARK